MLSPNSTSPHTEISGSLETFLLMWDDGPTNTRDRDMSTVSGDKTLDELHHPDSSQDAIINSNPRHANEDTFPEGGQRAWLSLLGCFCAWMCAFGLMNVGPLFIAATPCMQRGADEVPIVTLYQVFSLPRNADL